MRVARIDLLHPDPTNALGRVEIRFPEIEFDYFDTDLFTPAYIVSYFECVLGSQNVDAACLCFLPECLVMAKQAFRAPAPLQV
jgi:hypothetical protein